MRVGLHHLYFMVRGVSVEDILHCRLSSILPLVETGLMVEPSENYLIGHLAHFPDFSYREDFEATERLRNRSNLSLLRLPAESSWRTLCCIRLWKQLGLKQLVPPEISLIGAIYGLWRNLDESNVGCDTPNRPRPAPALPRRHPQRLHGGRASRACRGWL
jgi:hypothetical protein